LGGQCCPEGRAVCDTGSRKICCGGGEYCLWKVDVDPSTGDELAPLGGVCKRGCTQGNRAGGQCCGTGYRPNRRRTACVRSTP
jgi:hypothetical protein